MFGNLRRLLIGVSRGELRAGFERDRSAGGFLCG